MKHFLIFLTIAVLLLGAQSVLADDHAVQTAVTPTPTTEPPFGAPGKPSFRTFRRYYQIRCYPGCHKVQKGPTPTPTREPPFGRPGKPSFKTFRRYYQIRCYPGCHVEQKGPQPRRVHP